MTDLQLLLHSQQAEHTLLLVSAKDMCKLVDDMQRFAIERIKEKDEPSYYTRQELAEKFHITLTTVQRWRDRGYLPEPVTIDGRVLYDKAEVRDHINNNFKLRFRLNQKGIRL